MTSTPYRTLVLFDIDGTLIRANRAGSKAMYRAMERFVGRGDAMRAISMAGLVDWSIWRQALAAEGYSADEVDAHLPELWQSYVTELAYILADPAEASPLVLPGVLSLLDSLSGREDVLLGLLTGNVEGGAWLKLGSVGLDRYFRFGAFGNDAAERPSLPAIAVHRAARFAGGYHFSGSEIVIVGDTIHDVRCCEPVGGRAIGIATGPASTGELLAAGAVAAFESFEPPEPVLAAILDEGR